MKPLTLARYLSLLLLLVLAGSGITLPAKEPLFDTLGSYSRPISTTSPEAQRYFDQGLRFLFGYNHSAAIRAFQTAAQLDPASPMPHWGIALACGPHINFPLVPPPAAVQAWQELTLARDLLEHASPLERELIATLGTRYANPQPEDRSSLDRSYADALRTLWQAHPDDADIGALFAEALLDLRPWDQWTLDGKPQPGTEEILATLEAVLALDLNHPLANHLYIHAVEASPLPGRALAAADRLLTLQPGLAHNVHMPSHIYIRVGRWAEAIESNYQAVAAAAAYRKITGPVQGFLNVYVAHNEHMLAYAAMMTGRSRLAAEHINALVAGLSPEFMQEFSASGSEAWLALPMEISLRFGRWDEILAEPLHPESQPFTHAFQYAARGIAYAAKGEPAKARLEQLAYLAAAKKVPADEPAAGNNLGQTILAIVTPMLEGEILIREDKLEAGLSQLRTAIANEDHLKYDEPPGWLIPVRHSLGATLMTRQRYAEAEEVYREDLRHIPENGWSLFGLSEALRFQGKDEQAIFIRTRFDKIWDRADISIKSSCFCQPNH